MLVYILGFMGSGKSTIGRLVAQQLGYKFMDLDRELEMNTGKTIGVLFEKLGEDGFRKLEHELLSRHSSGQKTVISLGGGTPCFHQNMDVVTRTGTSFFLDVDRTELAERLDRNKTKRPLIRNLDKQGILNFIDEKMKVRRPYYEMATYQIQPGRKGKIVLANELVSLLLTPKS